MCGAGLAFHGASPLLDRVQGARAGPSAGGEREPARAAGMLALHGIFTLVTRHGLEYPRFYERLYQLLTPAAFQARLRALP